MKRIITDFEKRKGNPIIKKGTILLFAILLSFKMCFILVSAASVFPVSSESDLLNAISVAMDGDIIEVNTSFSISNEIMIPSGKTLTVKGVAGTIILTASSSRHFNVEGGLILEDITLDGGGTTGGIYVFNGSLVIESGSMITNCSSPNGGAGVFLKNGSTFTMNAGEISNNHQSTVVAGSGGGVYLEESTFIMNGGEISNNSAVWGGGVSVDKESSFTMNDGKIDNNKTTKEYGGGIYVNIHGVFEMNGGTISNNQSDLGGGVFVGQGTYVSGDPHDWCKVIMNGGNIINNKALSGGGIAAMWNGQIEMNGGKISFNDASSGGGIFLNFPREGAGSVSFIMLGGEIVGNHSDHGGGLYAYAQNRPHPNSIKIVIGDSTGPSIPIIYDNYAGTSGYGGGLCIGGFQVNTSIYNAKIYKNEAAYGGGIAVYSSSTLNVYGGIIGSETVGEGNIATKYGGGIFTITGRNSIFIENSSIIGNTADDGGGIHLNNAIYSIDNAEIKDNHSANDGGGIYIGRLVAELQPMSKVSIKGNKANGNGGGIYISNQSLGTDVSVEKSAFLNNSASNGGGAYVSSNTLFSTSGGTSFINNSAVNEGGGIYTQKYTGYTGGIPGNYSGLLTGDYGNITTDADTIFSGNTSTLGYSAPGIAISYTNIGYFSTSIIENNSYMHPINNYDINFVDGSPLTFHVLTYDANGGTGSTFILTLVFGDNRSVKSDQHPSLSYSCNGHTFKGWNTMADGSGTRYNVGDLLIINGDITLYAQWAPKVKPATSPPTRVDHKRNASIYLGLFCITSGILVLAKLKEE